MHTRKYDHCASIDETYTAGFYSFSLFLDSQESIKTIRFYFIKFLSTKFLFFLWNINLWFFIKHQFSAQFDERKRKSCKLLNNIIGQYFLSLDKVDNIKLFIKKKELLLQQLKIILIMINRAIFLLYFFFFFKLIFSKDADSISFSFNNIIYLSVNTLNNSLR